jgi:hypothetical protein
MYVDVLVLATVDSKGSSDEPAVGGTLYWIDRYGYVKSLSERMLECFYLRAA